MLKNEIIINVFWVIDDAKMQHFHMPTNYHLNTKSTEIWANELKSAQTKSPLIFMSGLLKIHYKQV